MPAPDAVAHAVTNYPSVATLFVDSAYAGQLVQTVEQNHGIRVEVIRHPAHKMIGQWQADDAAERVPVKASADGFVPLPKRWIVEWTHAWNERTSRLIMHHDRLLCVFEAWVWLTEARILLRRMTTTTKFCLYLLTSETPI